MHCAARRLRRHSLRCRMSRHTTSLRSAADHPGAPPRPMFSKANTPASADGMWLTHRCASKTPPMVPRQPSADTNMSVPARGVESAFRRDCGACLRMLCDLASSATIEPASAKRWPQARPAWPRPTRNAAWVHIAALKPGRRLHPIAVEPPSAVTNKPRASPYATTYSSVMQPDTRSCICAQLCLSPATSGTRGGGAGDPRTRAVSAAAWRDACGEPGPLRR